MEIMEEGNLMDRVRILLQRDLAYYQQHQTVLQENLCPGVVGGLLDFPHYASFAAVKLVLWWEEAYIAAFRRSSGLLENGESFTEEETEDDRGCGGVATTSTPQEFLSIVTTSASQLLEHLHTLSQEALDHADLTVLTGTLGAAALIKNCLWCYNEQLKKRAEDSATAAAGRSDTSFSLHNSYKKFHEMSEALAERLLDLHCRLLSLYVLQDADCLNWEDPHPFFEGERGSFVIQMWWLYMQGTRENLWNTVPPKTAQRVLSGMLNESLTILTVRYTQAVPSSGRSSLLVTDIGNLLLCVRQLLPSICSNAQDLLGHSPNNKILNDLHAKCHELLTCLLIRGCPLATLYKVFRKGIADVPIFLPRDPFSPAPWLMLTSPHLFPNNNFTIHNLSEDTAIALELSVLVAQPQASWPVLLKVLMMNSCKVSNIIMKYLYKELHEVASTSHKIQTKKETRNIQVTKEEVKEEDSKYCGRFLCSGAKECLLEEENVKFLPTSVIMESLVFIITTTGGSTDLSITLGPMLEKTADNWGGCIDRQQIWNQSRPPWLKAILKPLEQIMAPVCQTLLTALQDGASVDQTSVLALDCLGQLMDCLPLSFLQCVNLLEDLVPANVKPMADSVLLQLLLSALYSQLETNANTTALCEALCSLDRVSKHADKIQTFIMNSHECFLFTKEDFSMIENIPYMEEVAVSDLLQTAPGRRALKVMWQFLQHSSCWILGQLEALEIGEKAPLSLPLIPATASRPAPINLLHTMFYIGNRPFDQLLSGTWELNWSSLLKTKLGLSPDRLWVQLSCRSEFQESSDFLNQHDAAVVNTLIDMFQAIPCTPLKS